MNDNFNEQKEKLVAINQEISLLRQQINYLLRNEKPLGLLDLDVLMNRTHTVYDMLCSINLGDHADEEDLDIDPEAFAGLFGGLAEDETSEETVTAEEEVLPEEGEAEEEADEEPEQTVMEEERVEEEPKPEPMEETFVEVADEPEVEVAEEPTPVEEEAEQEGPDSDEYGFFFRFEDQPSEEPEPVAVEETLAVPVEHHDRPVVTEDGKLVHFVEEVPEEEIPARDLVDGDSIVRDNPFEMPRMEDDSDEPDFEMAPETLGESLMHEDYTLAAKLQQNPVRDLKSVIGINDKFLFVNELFGGSMEKYNKSIENLNDLKTLNGAMIYLNELKIELQWNSSNEAYQKLADLVTRKFD